MRLGTIAFLLGIVLLQQLPRLPAISWCWLLLLLVPVAVRFPVVRLPVLAVVGFLWALLWAGLALERNLPAELEGVELSAQGSIASIPVQRAHSVRFDFDIDHLSRDGQALEAPGRVRLSWYGHVPSLNAGDRWRLIVRLKRPSGFMNPGGFDYEGWLFQQGFSATGYVRRDARNRFIAAGYGLNRLRQGIAARLEAALGDSRNLGVLTALAIGERSGISSKQWALLTATGTNHLLAISGLHIGLVAGLVFFLVRRLWSLFPRLSLHWPAPKAAALAGLAAAGSYAALAGFSIPTRRALIMLAVAMGAILLQRNSAPSRTLAVALALVLLLDPVSVLAPGFWMSFAAVAVILYGMSGRLGAGGIWWKWGRVQWLVAVGLLPLTLFFFQRAALVSPLANLLAVPWVSLLIVPLVLLATILLPFGGTASAGLLLAADHLLTVLWGALQWLSQLPLAQWSQHAPSFWAVLAALAGVGVLLAPRGYPGRGLGLLLLLPMFAQAPSAPRAGAVQFTLLDVGQGLAAVIRTREHVLVYDTGPRFSETFDAGAAVVVPYLRELGVKRIDRLVISHANRDHTGGLGSILEQMDVGGVLAGVPAAVRGVRARACASGQGWEWDGVKFRILHPPPNGGFRGNDRSCVLRVDATGGSILLTGDIERRSEHYLLRQQAGNLGTSILVAPHHGSSTSSGRAFVRAVHPHYVLFPVGYRNRFGFPKPQVLGRYRDLGAILLDSAQNGAITLVIDPQTGVEQVQAYRQTARHYWNRH